MNENQPLLQGGVLIIGSLYWEDETNCLPGQEAKGKLRKTWRENFLITTKQASTKLPTRYGRLSGENSRKETYTMVLSNEYWIKQQTGTGLAVPFRESIIDYDYFKKQAIELARVEEIFKDGEREKLGVDFSGIAIWINNDSVYRGQLEQWWAALRTDTELPYEKAADHYAWKDGSLLTNDFRLSLELKDCPLDFAFCTYIRPRYKAKLKGEDIIMEYPTAEEIADAMYKNGYETYFQENRKNGITTYDDADIERLLQQNKSNPSTLDPKA